MAERLVVALMEKAVPTLVPSSLTPDADGGVEVAEAGILRLLFNLPPVVSLHLRMRSSSRIRRVLRLGRRVREGRLIFSFRGGAGVNVSSSSISLRVRS